MPQPDSTRLIEVVSFVNKTALLASDSDLSGLTVWVFKCHVSYNFRQHKPMQRISLLRSQIRNLSGYKTAS